MGKVLIAVKPVRITITIQTKRHIACYADFAVFIPLRAASEYFGVNDTPVPFPLFARNSCLIASLCS
jgi:hypothetical protein